MSDEELVTACAKALGLSPGAFPTYGHGTNKTGYMACGGNNWADMTLFDPLNDDAHAMALVKKMKLDVFGVFDMEDGEYRQWGVATFGTRRHTLNIDLNRAICECVAAMQLAKTTPPPTKG